LVEGFVFKSNFSKCLSFLALLAVFVSVAAQQSDQQPQSEPEIPAAAVTPTPAPGDNAAINLHRWGAVTLFHGLPSDRVNAITEDAGGVLWFGTDTGLVRYDGRNVEAAPTAPNEAALPSRRILALKFDHRGRLWIGTDAGAARLIGNRIEVLPETRGRAVSGIAFSQQGEVTVVTGAGEIIRYREQVERGQGARELIRSASSYINPSDSNTAITVAGKLDPNAHPLLKSPKQPGATLPLAAVIPGSSGDWLIGSTGRGLLINHENDLREASTRTPRPYFVSSIYDDGERVWLAEQASARAGGLWFWKDGALTRTSFQSGQAGPLTAVHGGDGELWVGSTKQGAFLLRYENGGVKVVEHLTFDNTAGGLRSDQINAIFRDHEGVVWFGSDRGVCRYDRSSFRASTISGNPQSNYVRTMLHASNGETWLGSNRGLFKLATRGKASASEEGDPDRGDSDSWGEVPELDGRSIYALTEDNGAIWVGAVGGLFVKSKGASNFSRVLSATEASISAATGANAAGQPAGTQQAETQPATQEEAPQQPEVAGDHATKEIVRAIAGFRGQIYAAFYEGRVERVDTTASGFTRAPASSALNNDAAAKRVTCMAVERQNGADAALWYGTADGELRRFDGSRTAVFALPQKQQAADRGIRALAVTERGVWIGSAQGLYLREGDSIREIRPDVDVWSLLLTREIRPKSEMDGAPREVVWIATRNAGLFKLLPDQGIWARFDTEQGLPSQQIFALAPGENGEIWVGANRGVARHRPSQVEPRLQIKRLVAPEKIYLPEQLTGEVSLPHTTRSLLLEVTGVGSKTFSSQFQYEFARLDNNGNEEKKIQSAPQFAVENLKSGSYTIVARAVSRDLVYSAPLSVRLRILSAPPPLLSVLLATLLAVAVAAAALAFRQQFRLASANRALEKTNIELTETRLRLANETETERSRIARDLHDQTLADLRRLLVMTDQLANGAPPPALSSDSPASDSSSSDSPASDSEDSTPSPAALRREIEVISSGIRHICEDLSPSALENIGFLPALEWALSSAVAQLPAHEKFAYEFICDASLEDRLRLSDIERIQLYRMVQEALNNVARHARAKQVKMKVRAQNPADLVIEIHDDGVGFDGATINKTGHGIANIRSRANLIGAKAEWKNARPGCRFEIRKEGCVNAD
jgi:signal transduction histidine kinase/ligand-binding sensor domain-containing protein